jgi:glutamate synthase domain-containing protein 2
MRRLFWKLSLIFFLSVFILGYFYPGVFWSMALLLPIFLFGAHNALQKKRAILRNFPILGSFRYFFEMIRPEIQQYFVESETDGTPISREIRSVVYQRAKLQTDTLPFGTQRDVYAPGYEWISHSLSPKHVDPVTLRVIVGGPQCLAPYSASIFNISAMSYGALSKNAITALNGGAKLGGFYHNTGEGGLSPYHLSPGGDVVWQIGTGYFGCRNNDGSFNSELFKKNALLENVKMIEIKLSQGAKPSHGGILPAAKITKEIMEIRKVEGGKDVVSPPAHTAFSTPEELVLFIKQLRDLSGGKPIGFKLCLGRRSEFIAICKAIIAKNIYPDFITIDGGEGGTGAAPMEFSDSMGTPLEDGLVFVHNILRGFNLRKDIRLIASGKIMTGFNIFSRLALGADLCNSARGMMMALGCIQARSCNTNRCPSGVATSDPELVFGLDPSDKQTRVYNYHRQTVLALSELVGASGLQSIAKINRQWIHRRISRDSVRNYAELFPLVDEGAFLAGNIPPGLQEDFHNAFPNSFDLGLRIA